MTIIKKGAVDQTFYFKLVDSTAGTPETAISIASIDACYTRYRRAVVKNDLTSLSSADAAHADNQAIAVDVTNAPGLYRVDFPDAAFASSSDVPMVILNLVCTGVDPVYKDVELVDYNPFDGVRLGLTALPNAAADAAGGLIISDAGGLDADAQRADVAAILVDTGTTLDGRIPAALVGGRMDASVGAVAAGAITAAAIADGAIDAATFAAGAINAAAIADGAIDAAAIAANAIGASELAADAANEIADAILARNVAGGSSTGRIVSEALYVLRNKTDIAAGTLTVYGTDDTTPAFTAAVTTTAGDPISTIDPA